MRRLAHRSPHGARHTEPATHLWVGGEWHANGKDAKQLIHSLSIRPHDKNVVPPCRASVRGQRRDEIGRGHELEAAGGRWCSPTRRRHHETPTCLPRSGASEYGGPMASRIRQGRRNFGFIVCWFSGWWTRCPLEKRRERHPANSFGLTAQTNQQAVQQISRFYHKKLLPFLDQIFGFSPFRSAVSVSHPMIEFGHRDGKRGACTGWRLTGVGSHQGHAFKPAMRSDGFGCR